MEKTSKLGSLLCTSASLPSVSPKPPPAPGPTCGVQPSATALRSCPIRHAVQRPSSPEPSAWQTQLSPHLPARPGPAPRASPLTPLLAPQRPGPSASGSGKSGCGQGSAGCDLSRAQTTLPQFLHLDNRRGPFAPGYGMQPDGCFPNCSPGCLAPGARPGLSYGGTKKICGLWGPGWGQVEGRQATHTGAQEADSCTSPHRPGGGDSHTRTAGTWPLASPASCPICTRDTLNHLLWKGADSWCKGRSGARSGRGRLCDAACPGPPHQAASEVTESCRRRLHEAGQVHGE